MSLLTSLFGSGKKFPPDQTREILARHLNADFRVFPLAEQRLRAEEVLDAGKRLGVPLPPEFIAHVAGEFPGVYVEAKAEVWPRPKELDVGPFWSFLYAIQTFTASPDSEEWMRMESVGHRLHQTPASRRLRFSSWSATPTCTAWTLPESSCSSTTRQGS